MGEGKIGSKREGEREKMEEGGGRPACWSPSQPPTERVGGQREEVGGGRALYEQKKLFFLREGE